jgi:hypothetical protein
LLLWHEVYAIQFDVISGCQNQRTRSCSQHAQLGLMNQFATQVGEMAAGNCLIDSHNGRQQGDLHFIAATHQLDY